MTPDRLTEIASEFNNAYRLGTFDVWLTGQELVDIADLALDGMTLRQMEQNDMNRDYFSKPIQTSRNMHGYGNTGPLSEPEAPNWRPPSGVSCGPSGRCCRDMD